MITYKNDHGECNKLTVTELKKELEKLEEKGCGDFIGLVGYDSNSCYESIDAFNKIRSDDEFNYVLFDTDTTF